MKKQTKSLSLGVIATVMVLGTAAWAGAKSGSNVTISFSGGNGTASGAMGYVRNSADTVQYIGCTLITSATASSFEVTRTVSCSARNSSNVVVSCVSTDGSLIDSVQALNSDSYITFQWNVDGRCTYLRAGTYSQYAPKEP